MSIQGTINTTIRTIQACAELAKNTITGTVQGIAYLFTNFPQVLKGAFDVFKGSLVLGQLLMTSAWDAFKYITQHIPEIAKGIFNLAVDIFKYFPDVLKFVGYDLPKFFLYDVPKATLKHLPAIANWFVKHIPDLIAHGIGVILGVVYAPFKIMGDFLFGTNKHNQNNAPRAHYRGDPIAEGLLVGVVGAALVADSFRKDIDSIERDMGTQNHYAPSYDRHKAKPNASSNVRDEQGQRVKHSSISKLTAG